MIDGDILPIEMMARREYWNDGISIYMRQRTVGQGALIAQKVKMEKLENNAPAEPMLRLSVHEAQQLIDELWQCGLRPTEGAGSAGAMAATQKHLEDMRTLVFKQLENPNA